MADIECLGMLATLLVIASFVFQNIVLIRLVNGIGAALFIVLRGNVTFKVSLPGKPKR